MSESNVPATAEEPATPPPSPGVEADSAAAPRQPMSAAPALVIALLALGLAIGLAVTAYFTWHQVQQLAQEQAGIESGVSDRIKPLRQSLEGLERAMREADTRLDGDLERLVADQQSVGHRLNVLAALMGRSEHGWTLAEVEYLLRIANQRLQLQRDLDTARTALLAADGRLRDLADPHYQSVRDQIARDLEAIGAVPVVDTRGLSAKLGAALAALDELPVSGVRYQPVAASASSGDPAAPTAGTLEELPEVVWGALSELFRMREHDQAVTPMLPPEREYFLRENLRLQLAAARLALLRNDREQFRTALMTAADWLQGYFDRDDTAVGQQLGELQAMAAVDIVPPVPDVSASLRLLRQQIKLSEQAEILPVVPESVSPDTATVSEAETTGSDEEVAP